MASELLGDFGRTVGVPDVRAGIGGTLLEIKDILTGAVEQAAKDAIQEGALPEGQLPQIVLEVPPTKEFGDFATNFAMQSARVFHRNPRQIAEELAKRIKGDWLDHTQIAGPGFLNFYLKGNVLYDSFQKILEAGESFGNLPKLDHPKIQVEYVSANPTGLLHVGHGRGAAAGSALVNLLRAAGYPVESEYYINDAGNQMNNLARSVNTRYLELLGREVTFPEDGYHGQDIIDTAQRIIDRDGDKYLALSEEERLDIFKDLAYHEKLAILKEDLERFHVTFDKWFSERTLHPDAVREVVEILKEKGDIYEKDGALWLKSTAYGDDKDRVVIRDNGVPTYLAADIAYHHNKYERGFDRLINIWGADHHGYVCRVKAAMQALGHDPEKLTVLLLQMVSLYRGGELVKMSKRTGQSVTLNELMEEVGTDAARYFFLMRSLDSQLDFDLDLAKKKSNDNPVYYIQYAHARICSIFRQAQETKLALGKAPKLDLLTDESEVALIKKIEEYPEEVKKAADDYAPQRIARYSYDLAALFHSFYNKCRIMGVDHDSRRRASRSSRSRRMSSATASASSAYRHRNTCEFGLITHFAKGDIEMDFLKSSEVDVAYYILTQSGEKMYYKDLVLEVIEKTHKPVQSLSAAISEVYTLINMDSRFHYEGEGQWGLTEWNPPEVKRSHSSRSTSGSSKAAAKASSNRKKKLESIQE